jgi:arginase family enzyme
MTNLEGLAPLVRDEDVAVLGYRSTVNDSYLDEHVRDTAITVEGLGDVERDGIGASTERALATAARPDLDGVWLHFDVDVLDDALMSAVDYREHRQPHGAGRERRGRAFARWSGWRATGRAVVRLRGTVRTRRSSW